MKVRNLTLPTVLRSFPLHSLQPVYGVCVLQEKPHLWHQTALLPAAQTAMRKKARQSLHPARQSPRRPSPPVLARRPSGSLLTLKMRGRSSPGIHAHQIMKGRLCVGGVMCPPPSPIQLLSALLEPYFLLQPLLRTILLPSSLFFF